MKNSKLPSIIVFLSLSLTGCLEGNRTTNQLCENNAELQCDRLNINDGQCRHDRTELIWHRYEELKTPSDANKIQEYHLTSKYRQCLELAAQITLIDQAELKKQRVSALMHSINALDRIKKELEPSTEPETLYFLWTQTGDKQAQRRFLQLENTPELNTAELQYALATYYTKRDPEKSVKLLMNSIALDQKMPVNTQALKALASTNHSLKRYQDAYLWTMIGQYFDVSIASKKHLALLFPFKQEEFERLDKLAASLAVSIKKGTFSPELFQKDEIK
ncbi:hypothetical protein BCU68_16155 [Vibrio sp. 10N.286.49.B3]|uniref:DUF2989 domain-containing protein n=1 Tax=Vibrio sp. 10N.286.49.B3 TaxID=1880855 RepID=UPI000C845B03|nr:DUF2989 domain-containing protein [Vibrio sp. 10N.286.49.B3]PMH40591.1 hypothetical protein BCU68_16155 [Vibrio sp. 10N.286.49.B3]